MARPGLKPPPRHAVVVRGGDAPRSEDIPVARPSVPPPPAPSEPPPASASEKITLRAIPTPSTPPPPDSESPPAPSEAPQSVGPPSDAPFIAASVRGADSSGPSSRRRPSGSSWMIGVAVAAGLLLGLASVATRARAPGGVAQPRALPPSALAADQPAAVPLEAATDADADATDPSASPEAASNAAPVLSVPGHPRLPRPKGGRRPALRQPIDPRKDATASKRNIF